METRHVRVDYDSALVGKKQLLNSEINLLQILKKIRSYKILMSKELIIKSRLRIQLSNLRKKINIINDFLQEGGSMKSVRKKKVVEDRGQDIQGDLDEIRRKLEKLG